MSYPNNHKHKFFQKDHEKVMCSECEFELDGEYYVGYVLPLEAQIKELKQALTGRTVSCSQCNEMGRKAEQAEKHLKSALLVGYKCEHIAKDEIGGDCVHCNLVVAEHCNAELQKQYESALNAEGRLRDEIDALVKERDLYNKNYLALESQNARLREALEEAVRDCEIFDACGDLERAFPSTVRAIRANQKRYQQALQRLSNQAEIARLRLSNQGDGK